MSRRSADGKPQLRNCGIFEGCQFNVWNMNCDILNGCRLWQSWHPLRREQRHG